MHLRGISFLLSQRLDVGLCPSRGRDMSRRLHDCGLRVRWSLLNMLTMLGWWCLGLHSGLGGQRGGRPDWSPGQMLTTHLDVRWYWRLNIAGQLTLHGGSWPDLSPRLALDHSMALAWRLQLSWEGQ